MKKSKSGSGSSSDSDSEVEEGQQRSSRFFNYLDLFSVVKIYPPPCLGSGSVGSAIFWLPGSGSAKTCGSMDTDPRG